MHWLKRITVTFFSLVIFIIINMSLLLIILNNEDYRKLTVSLIEYYTELEISINGEFKFDISLIPELQTTLIQIHDTNNNFTITIDKINIAIVLRSLFFNNLWIKDLQVDNVNITLKDSIINSESSVQLNQKSEKAEVDIILLPILENLDLHNIVFNIEQESSTLNNYASITRLSLGKDNEQNKLILESNGLLNGYKFNINGNFGNLKDLILPVEPYPVDASLKISDMQIDLTGDVQQPLSGTGLNLTFDAKNKDILNVFRNDKNKMPFIGAFSAFANITGNAPNIAIENLDIKLNNDKKTAVSITGNIPEIETGKNTIIKVTSALNDPAIYAWLIPDGWPVLKKLSVNTIIKNNKNGDYTLNDILITSTLDDGSKLKVTGSTTLKDISKKPFRDVNLNLTAHTRTAKILQQLITEYIPDFGAIDATAKLVSVDDHYSLKNLIATTGTTEKLRIKLKGHIHHITPFQNKPVTGLSLKFDAQANNNNYLKKLLKIPLPDLQNMRLTTELYDNKDLFSLKDILFVAGQGQQPSVKISGYMTDITNAEGTFLNTELDIKTTKLLQAIKMDKQLAEPGTTTGSFVFQHKDSSTSLEKIKLSLSKPEAWNFTAAGYIKNLFTDQNFSIKTTSEITDWTNLKKILNRKKLDFSTETGTGELIGNINNVNIRNNIQLGSTKISSNISIIKKNNRYAVKSVIESPIMDLNDFGIKPKDDTINGNKNTNANEIKPKNEKKNSTINEDILPFDKLNTFDLDATFKIGKFSKNDSYLNELDVKLVIESGNLRIYPAKLKFRDSSIEIDLGISGNNDYNSYLKFDTRDISLGDIMSEFQKTPAIKGSLDALINLQSSGNSLKKISTNSTGDIVIIGENIEVLRKYTSLLASDTLGWATSKLGLSKEYDDWSCTIFRFNFSDNKLESDALIIDGPDMRIKGELSIDLNDETIDMSIWPTQKNTIWLNVSPMKLNGPIRDPSINAVTLSTMNATRTSVELLFFPIFIPLRAVGYVKTKMIDSQFKKNGPCQKLEQELLKEKQD
ncbi:MAG: AsmA family protein [Thiohalomonadales bacterium]